MRIGVFQFSSCHDIERNYSTIVRAIESAAEKGVRLLVFSECALTGYPPVETPSVGDMDFDAVNVCLDGVRQLARRHQMYIALGTARKGADGCYNSIVLITPEGDTCGIYDKRALWGWDLENFKPGISAGIFEIDGIKAGFRICFEVRFPEYFRELFREDAELCFISFSDVSKYENTNRYELIKAHLRTRAMENIMTVVSVNSISGYQTAPTAVFSTEGFIEAEAPVNTEHLLVYDYEKPEISFGASGRRHQSRLLDGR